MAWTVSGELIVMVLLGGMGTLMGPVVGALVFLLLEEGLKGLTDHWLVIMGPVIVLIVLFLKNGLWGILRCAAAREAADMTQALLSIQGLVKRYGGLLVTDHVDLDVRAGEVHAIIGPNGAGKTTLISQIVGEVRNDAGSIGCWASPSTAWAWPSARAGIGRSYQITSVIGPSPCSRTSSWRCRAAWAMRTTSGSRRARRPSWCGAPTR
jgi:ABC-type transport system involved in cytochrome bd biosynthesis fused ATPase/permease subunit